MNFCPKCGEEGWTPSGNSRACGTCGFTLYFNTAAAVAAIIVCDEAVLASVRAREPDSGKLDLPGGFVDFGETAETALRRELKEELGIEGIDPTYFGTYPNRYPYKSIDYYTLDLVFTISIDARQDMILDDEIAAVRWIPRSTLDPDAFAFASIKACLADYLLR